MSYFKDDMRGRRFPFLVLMLILLIVAAILGGIVALYAAGQMGYFSSAEQQQQQETLSNSNDSVTSSAPQNDLDVGEADRVAVIEKVQKCVVGISNIQVAYDNYFGQKEEEAASGSGVIISSDGYIVTNNHVISGAQKIVVSLYDNTNHEAKVIGADARSDLALLKINATDLNPAVLGDSDILKVGEVVLAIGNPGGSEFARSATQGIISGLNRLIVTEAGLAFRLIQTDAAINPGNSGGALINSTGQVIGINSIKISAENFEGMGFAIPINTVKGIIDQLKTNGYVKRPALGVNIWGDITADIAKYNNLNVDYGVAVLPLSGSNAAKAGMQNYDIIIAIDGEKITTYYELQEAVFAKNIGDTVKVTVNRDGKELNFNVALGELSH